MVTPSPAPASRRSRFLSILAGIGAILAVILVGWLAVTSGLLPSPNDQMVAEHSPATSSSSPRASDTVSVTTTPAPDTSATSTPTTSTSPTTTTHRLAYYVTLVCEESGSPCNATQRGSGGFMLGIQGIDYATLTRLCGQGWTEVWTDNHHQTLNPSTKHCEWLQSTSGTKDPLMAINADAPVGAWTITWTLYDPQGQVQATADFFSQIVVG